MQRKIVAVWIALGFATLVQVAKPHVEVERDEGEDINYGNFKEFLNHTLNVSQVLASIYVEDFVECAFRCIATLGCFSFNIASASSISPNNNVCHLLATDKYNHSSNFVPSEEFHHYAIASPCESFPCQNDGKCRTLYKENAYVCECREGFTGKLCSELKKTAKNCGELYRSGERISGVYTIDPDDGLGAFDVFCDQKTAGGGWTVFQKRLNGSVDFYRGWDDYKRGFGNLSGEFWLGLDKIHRLTKTRNKLRVDLEDTTSKAAYAEYDMFAVTSEKYHYQLSLGNYSGDAGDSFSGHRGCSFTTKDQDHDKTSSENCAVTFKGAWWYHACHGANLNGMYHLGNHSSYADGINWYTWKGHYYSAKRAEMKITPASF